MSGVEVSVIDQKRFLAVVSQIKIETIDIGRGAVRWHRRDIEKAVSKLLRLDWQALVKRAPRMRSLNDATIDKIAAAVAVRFQDAGLASCPSWCHAPMLSSPRSSTGTIGILYPAEKFLRVSQRIFLATVSGDFFGL